MKNLNELRFKTIVITGASSGAGKAIALELATYNTKLVLAGRNADTLAEVVSACKNLGSDALAIIADVTDAKAVINLADAATKHGGKIDVWINNAGVLAAGEFDVTPIEVHEQVIKTNLLGYINGAHAVLPYFKKQQYGIIINNISVGGYLPVPFGAGYSASKFGLKGFSSALKAELISWPDIHVCDLYAAFLDTPGIQHAANYTGKVLRPAPPVYDPKRLAMAVVQLIQHPKSYVYVGSFSPASRITYSLFPAVVKHAMNKFMKFYFKQADSIASSNGNLFNPVKYGTSVYGGWGLPGKPKAHQKYIAGSVLLAAAAGLLYALGSNNKS